MEKYFTYILYSESRDSYYIGYTSNLDTRLLKHNSGSTPSTKSGIPWRLVYHEEFRTKAEALMREKAIKQKKSRKYIEYLLTKE